MSLMDCGKEIQSASRIKKNRGKKAFSKKVGDIVTVRPSLLATGVYVKSEAGTHPNTALSK